MADSKSFWWATCRRFTVGVEVADGKVASGSAPLVQKFVGQPIGNLWNWMTRIGGFAKKRIE